MNPVILDGKELSKKVKQEIRIEVEKIKNNYGKVPGLAVVLVGANPASKIYVTNKKKSTIEVGMESFSYELREDTREEELLNIIDDLNNNDKVDGILVQLPLPSHIDERKVIEKILPEKDVDGFHPYNLGKLMIGDEDVLFPCTPYGITKFFEEYSIDLTGKHVVVLGRSNIVGKPIANMLIQKKFNATVTVCHTKTKNLKEITKTADVVIVATGRANTLTADMVKEGVIVIDVGINRIEDPSTEKGYRIVGDVDFEGVKDKCSYITPVPGGVGPMTIAMLLYNTLKAFKKRRGIT